MDVATVSGLCIIIIAVLGLLFYIPFIVVVFHPSSKHKTSFFILAGWLGIADCICLLLMVAYAGPSTIWEKNMVGTEFNAIMGGLLNIGWFTSLPLVVFLAVDRWLCLCKKKWFNVVYSQQKTKCYISACWLFGIAYSIPSFTGCCPIYFTYEYLSWGWSVEHAGAQVLAIGELVMVILVVTVTYLCNGIVLR